MLSSYVVLLTPPPEFSVDLAHITLLFLPQWKGRTRLVRKCGDGAMTRSIEECAHVYALEVE